MISKLLYRAAGILHNNDNPKLAQIAPNHWALIGLEMISSSAEKASRTFSMAAMAANVALPMDPPLTGERVVEATPVVEVYLLRIV
jgi:hypothetical protein